MAHDCRNKRKKSKQNKELATKLTFETHIKSKMSEQNKIENSQRTEKVTAI